MSIEKINLDNIRSFVFTDIKSPLNGNDFEILSEYKEIILLAMKEACRQALELASEKAYCWYVKNSDGSNSVVVNKHSITNVNNLIE